MAFGPTRQTPRSDPPREWLLFAAHHVINIFFGEKTFSLLYQSHITLCIYIYIYRCLILYVEAHTCRIYLVGCSAEAVAAGSAHRAAETTTITMPSVVSDNDGEWPASSEETVRLHKNFTGPSLSSSRWCRDKCIKRRRSHQWVLMDRVKLNSEQELSKRWDE